MATVLAIQRHFFTIFSRFSHGFLTASESFLTGFSPIFSLRKCYETVDKDVFGMGCSCNAFSAVLSAIL